MNDKNILQHITELVDEEHKLRDGGNAARLKQVEVELDQCWDLLRQRRARREFGANPDDAAPRDPGTVENYEG